MKGVVLLGTTSVETGGSTRTPAVAEHAQEDEVHETSACYVTGGEEGCARSPA